MAGISLKNICKHFGKLAVLRDVSLEVGDHEFFVVVGPSGCGKSTLLRILAGLEQVSSGAVHIGGRRVDGLPPGRRNMAMVFQNYALLPHLTVHDNIAFGPRIRGTPRAEIRRLVMDAARVLELEPVLQKKPAQLSGGQCQRVALGRALVRKPDVFLFDEPLSNLDARLRGGMRAELLRLHARFPTTSVYVTHDQIEAMTLGERICVLHDGVVQQIAGAAEIYNRPANLFVATFFGAPPMNIVPARMRCDANAPRIVLADGVAVAPPPGLAAMLEADREISLGMRPEALRPAGAALPGDLRLGGSVEIVELTGADAHVHFRWNGQRLVARVDANERPASGAAVNFAVAPRDLHVFDENGSRI